MILNLFLLLCTLFTQAQIIEIKNINDALHYVRPEALFLIDLDNTVIEPANAAQIGSEQWFYSTLQLMQQEMPADVAKNKIITLFSTLMLQLELKLVEDTTADVLNYICQHCTTLGFTARALIVAPSTHKWLSHYSISFNAPVQDQGFMINEYPVLLYNKVIYCNGHKTGTTLFTILDAFGICPTFIVFIDDKEHYLEAIEQECNARNIEFIGLRYSYLDEKVANYLKQSYLNQPEIE